MEYRTVEELMTKAQEAIGKTFGEIDLKGRLTNTKSKGGLGQVIEESFFGYKINSDARPDFEELGIELKVTPFKQNKNKSISAKERLVLNIINYMDEVNTTFETSSFWKKNKKILLMFYEWLPSYEPKDFYIYKNILLSYPAADLEIIKQDWETIVEKIRNGKAHEISEGDTNYLGACTKGASKNSLRTQPNSNIPAMQRAFSLKQSYMTALLRKYVNNEELVSFAKQSDLQEKSLESLLNDKFAPYIGLTDKEIATRLNVIYNNGSKSFVPSLVSSLLGIKGTRLDKIEEFAKANIQFKTVRLEPNGKPKESMSFENIDFHQWTSESWDESLIREKFTTTKFLFVIFEFTETKKQNPDRKLYFKGINLWNMPLPTIDQEIKQIWEEVNRLLQQGLHIEFKKRGKKIEETNNLPKSSFNGVAHIKSKGKNGKDKVVLPNGQIISKQCFWLNSGYVAEIINHLDFNTRR
ncbi:Sau3AI family type II restriction endonuclease [Peribacillus sp. YIM B13482]|uniref:Sau3AI family type II restriction endonuclease n=1 Tax=Peribacillus sp. YIM B13482 TaxID=3366298 RepID=UPI003673409B